MRNGSMWRPRFTPVSFSLLLTACAEVGPERVQRMQTLPRVLTHMNRHGVLPRAETCERRRSGLEGGLLVATQLGPFGLWVALRMRERETGRLIYRHVGSWCHSSAYANLEASQCQHPGCWRRASRPTSCPRRSRCCSLPHGEGTSSTHRCCSWCSHSRTPHGYRNSAAFGSWLSLGY